MSDLVQRITEVYKVTPEQAVLIVRLLQSPNATDENFWKNLQKIIDKRIKGTPII